MTWTGQTLALFAAAEDAIRQIPPAFPLEATVAVNPWLGQAGEDRAHGRRPDGAGRRRRGCSCRARRRGRDDRRGRGDGGGPRRGRGGARARPGRAGPRRATPAPAPAPLPTLADLAQGDGRHRLAGLHRGADRPLGRGAVRPGAGVLAGAGGRGLGVVARLCQPRPDAGAGRADRLRGAGRGDARPTRAPPLPRPARRWA